MFRSAASHDKGMAEHDHQREDQAQRREEIVLPVP
jgi:hypothetical protein